MAPGRKDEVNFFWQRTYYDYLGACAQHGTFATTDQAQLAWIALAENVAVLAPRKDRILTSKAAIHIDYKGSVRDLPLEIKHFFDVPKHSAEDYYRNIQFDSPF